MKVTCWIVFVVGVVGVLFGIFLFATTHNPIALADTVWSGALAFGAYTLGDLKLVDNEADQKRWKAETEREDRAEYERLKAKLGDADK